MAIVTGSLVVAGIWTAIVGMFGSLFVKLLTWFTRRTAKVILVKVFGITLLVSITVALWVLIKATMFGLSGLIPPEVNQGMSMFLPDNTALCVSAIMSSRILIWAYTWQVNFVNKLVNPALF